MGRYLIISIKVYVESIFFIHGVYKFHYVLRKNFNKTECPRAWFKFLFFSSKRKMGLEFKFSLALYGSIGLEVLKFLEVWGV